jgi:hypothetical protein
VTFLARSHTASAITHEDQEVAALLPISYDYWSITHKPSSFVPFIFANHQYYWVAGQGRRGAALGARCEIELLHHLNNPRKSAGACSV